MQSIRDNGDPKSLAVFVVELEGLVRVLTGEYRVQCGQDHCHGKRVVQRGASTDAKRIVVGSGKEHQKVVEQPSENSRRGCCGSIICPVQDTRLHRGGRQHLMGQV